MLVFSYGIPRSGSTLAFELASGVALLGGHWQPMMRRSLLRPGRPLPLANTLHVRLPDGPPKTLKDRLLSFALQVAARRATSQGHPATVLGPELGLAHQTFPYVQNLDPKALPRLAEAAGNRILLIKTHAAPCEAWIAAYRELAARGQARVHVNHRDPRDICLALVDAARIMRARGAPEFTEFTSLDVAIAEVGRYLTELALWNQVPKTLHLHYETCAFKTDAAINLIKADLGLQCSNALVRHYAMRVAFTQRNKAVPNRHRSELDHRQLARLTEAFLPYLRQQGYLTGRIRPA